MDMQHRLTLRTDELLSWNIGKSRDEMLALAQAEAAKDTLPEYTPIAIAERDLAAIEHDIVTAENSSRYDAAHIRRLREDRQTALAKIAALSGRVAA